ncbi:MAG: carbon storage regulator [Planctomycetia bacterium]|nr:carbon storage regulator [Planctomycetia bacterium]
MLVLSRKIGERILIGEDIAITIVRISQGTVRIGVEAPRDMAVVREEVILNGETERQGSAPDTLFVEPPSAKTTDGTAEEPTTPPSPTPPRLGS